MPTSKSSKHGNKDCLRETLPQRFWKRIKKTDGCWLWQGRPLKGYGRINLGGKNGKSTNSQVASWLLHFGEVPEGKWVLHTCDNPRCVRPDHLFLGDPPINSEDQCKKRHQAAKLTWEKAQEIRSLYRRWSRQWGISKLAKRFGVGYGTAQAVIARRTWNHVPYDVHDRAIS